MSALSEQMLCQGLDLARGALDFYQNALEACTHNVGREVFERLRDDKAALLGRIRKVHESVTRTQLWPDVCKAGRGERERDVFDRIAAAHKEMVCPESELHLLGNAMSLELDMLGFYEKALENSSDADERHFLEMMVQETRAHYMLLNEMQFYYEDPGPWVRDRGSLR